jgi:glutaminyl-tRNA synthetase
VQEDGKQIFRFHPRKDKKYRVFKDHRPLYEWILTELNIVEPPIQREFGRVNLTGVITSKRYLRELVAGNFVDGWDDPRLPTIRGLRRRGFTAESIRMFVKQIGFVKQQSTVDYAMLESYLRSELKRKVKSVMAVLNPLKVTITNFENKTEILSIENNVENADIGSRDVPFSNVIFIEKDDFMEVPSKGFKRLSLHSEVRLKGALNCTPIVRQPNNWRCSFFYDHMWYCTMQIFRC